MKEIEVASFVPLTKIDPIFVQRSYYLEPEELGMKPFALLHRVLEDKQMVAIASFTLRKKEHACVLRAHENILALSPLFHKDEVETTDGLRKPGNEEVQEATLDLAKEYVEALSGDFNHAQ